MVKIVDRKNIDHKIGAINKPTIPTSIKSKFVWTKKQVYGDTTHTKK